MSQGDSIDGILKEQQKRKQENEMKQSLVHSQHMPATSHQDDSDKSDNIFKHELKKIPEDTHNKVRKWANIKDPHLLEIR